MYEREGAASPWGASIGNAMRRWWWIPVVFALVGAVIAGFASTNVTPRASATLLMESSAVDSQAMSRNAQSTLAQIRNSTAFKDAAAVLGTSEKDVASRTEVSASSDSLILTVQSRGTTPKQAADTANAVADAVVNSVAKSLSQSIANLNDQTSALMATATVKDAVAEKARVARLGEGLADSQTNLIRESVQVTPLAKANEGAAATASAGLMAVLGLAGGALLGLALAFLLGGRRGRIQTREDLERLYPNTEVVNGNELPDLIASYREGISSIIVATDRRDTATDATVAGVASSIERAGIATTVGPSVVGSFGDRGKVWISSARAGSLHLARRGAEPGVLVVYPVALGQTRIEDVDRVAKGFHEQSVLLTA